MAAVLGDDIDDQGADLAGQLGEVIERDSFQILRRVDFI
jgi:hypothetical protein